MENLNPATESRLNNELLSAEPVDNKGAPQADKKPKRNSKDDLTKKILQVVEKYQLDFEYSDTKMKRMSKTELQKLLAQVMEQCVKIDMAKAAGVDPRSNGKVITMGALRMLHNLAATGFEKVYNQFGPRFGYEIVGFSAALGADDCRECGRVPGRNREGQSGDTGVLRLSLHEIALSLVRCAPNVCRKKGFQYK